MNDVRETSDSRETSDARKIAGELTAAGLASDRLTSDQLTADERTVDELTEDQLTMDQPTGAQLTGQAHGSHVFTDAIPDLIQPGEYADHPQGRLVRVRIAVTDGGVEIVGDALRPHAVEDVLAALGEDGPMEQMLCG